MGEFWTLCSILFGVWLAMRLERAEARRWPLVWLWPKHIAVQLAYDVS